MPRPFKSVQCIPVDDRRSKTEKRVRKGDVRKRRMECKEGKYQKFIVYKE